MKLSVGFQYGVKGSPELDQAISEGKFHDEDAFEDYFTPDNLEDERDQLRINLSFDRNVKEEAAGYKGSEKTPIGRNIRSSDILPN